jgi:hypothetical protein
MTRDDHTEPDWAAAKRRPTPNRETRVNSRAERMALWIVRSVAHFTLATFTSVFNVCANIVVTMGVTWAIGHCDLLISLAMRLLTR